MINKLKIFLTTPVKAAPLAVFRILFGLLMGYALTRFVAHGWVDELYVKPKFFFTYFGFEFVKPLENYTYFLFIVGFLATIGITLGYRYRLSVILFFLSFTYIELIDKTTYLNHYYFVSLMAFLMIFIPANAYFSLDAKRNPNIAFCKISRFYILAIKFMLCIVYFYAGLAKVNSDWLINAMPLKIWLPSKFDLPLLGNLFQQEWMHYGMSWGGMLYDLTIPFLLFFKRTRFFAFLCVIIFHVLTRILFPIGIFPFVMIASTLIFFEANFHESLIVWMRKKLNISKVADIHILKWAPSIRNKCIAILFILFFGFQLLFPFRYLLYPDELFWTEEGYRFSWRVMLIEKAGYAQFKVVNPETQKEFAIRNYHFLSSFQEKQMQTQPDFILQYAHFLAKHYKKQGIKNPEVYVKSYVSLNGRLSQPFIDPTVDLTQIKESFQHKNWILPFNDTIYGF